jgi:hypothetical protein
MGDVVVASRFNYSIVYSSSNKSGVAVAKTKLDPSYFTKNLTLQEGYLEWAPDVVPALGLTQQFIIEST